MVWGGSWEAGGALKGLGGFLGWFWGSWGDLGRGPDVVSGAHGGLGRFLG